MSGEQNTYTIRGNDVDMGLNGYSVPWGVCTSKKDSTEKKEALYPNQRGNTGTRVTWDKVDVCALEVTRIAETGDVSSLPEPKEDDVVELDGEKYLVTKSEKTMTLEAATTFSIEVKRWVDLPLD